MLFGATGDLSQRMVWPSLYHLCREKLVPPTLTFVGSARNPMPNDEFRKFVEGALRKHVPAEFLKEDALADLLTRITYAPFEAGDGSAKGTEALQKALAGNNRILYFMATSPKFYGPTCLSLAAAGLACEHCRVVLEKPIGHDYASSVEINEAVGRCSTKTASSASTTTSAKRRCRTCSRCASRIRCSSRCGTRRRSITYRSR